MCQLDPNDITKYFATDTTIKDVLDENENIMKEANSHSLYSIADLMAI